MGKGSSPRTFSVSHEVFASNWDAIFKKGKKDVFQQETKDTNGTPEVASVSQERDNSSGDSPIPANDKPAL